MFLDFNDIELDEKYDFYSGMGFQVCETFIINLIEDKIDFNTELHTVLKKYYKE